MHTFRAKIQIIGINPYVLLPAKVLNSIFDAAAKNKGPIPVKGMINDHPFMQTLVKYSGKWRLYINGPMLMGSKSKLGDAVNITILFDAAERTVPIHPKLKHALQKNKAANIAFKALPPSKQKEIMRYINSLKTSAAIENNVKRAVLFLTGKTRFAGMERP